MTVEDVNDDSVQCSHFKGRELTQKTEWFPISELESIQIADGGFIDI